MSDSTHLTDHELVAALDGELPAAEIRRVDEHIAACWTCRTRRDALATAITDFVEARQAVLFARIPAPPTWPPLKPRLIQLDTSLHRAPARWTRLPHFLRRHTVLVTRWHTAAACATLFALVIIVVQSLYERPLAAAEVLARARPVETLDGHRQLTIEERDAASGRLHGRHHVHVWQNRARRVAARRLFDEHNRLVAGEWTSPDGIRTIVIRGQRQSVEPASTPIAITPSNAWRLSPGPVTFADLTAGRGAAAAADLAESADSYTLSAPMTGVADATIALTVRKADMYPVAQTLTMGSTIVSIVEVSFDATPASAMPASLFEPDGELLAPVANASVPPARPSVRASHLTEEDAMALELDAMLQLDRAGALLSERVSVVRSAEGVSIEARADTAARRDEMRAALAPLASRRGARVDVRTFAEAAVPEAAASAPPTVKVVEFTGTRGPLYDDLHAFVLARAAAAGSSTAGSRPIAVDAQIQRLTTEVMDCARRARQHARAVVQLASRTPRSTLHALDEPRRRAWWTAVSDHLRAFEDETRALRAALEPIFYAAEAAIAPAPPSPSSATVWDAAERLLAIAAEHDADVSRAFARSIQMADAPIAVRSPRFRDSLLASEALAAGMRAAASSPR